MCKAWGKAVGGLFLLTGFWCIVFRFTKNGVRKSVVLTHNTHKHPARLFTAFIPSFSPIGERFSAIYTGLITMTTNFNIFIFINCVEEIT